MTHESKNFFRKYWQAILIVVLSQFTMSFLGTFSSTKLNDFRMQQLELFKKEFDEDFRQQVNIVLWMHGVGILGKAPNNDHEHKKS